MTFFRAYLVNILKALETLWKNNLVSIKYKKLIPMQDFILTYLFFIPSSYITQQWFNEKTCWVQMSGKAVPRYFLPPFLKTWVRMSIVFPPRDTVQESSGFNNTPKVYKANSNSGLSPINMELTGLTEPSHSKMVFRIPPRPWPNPKPLLNP